MKSILIILGIAIIIIVGLLLFQSRLKGSLGGLIGKQGKVTIQKQIFNVTIAQTEREKETGLSGRSSLKENSGMIFIFDKEDYHAFWMKDMRFSIDIIYIKNKRVVTIIKNVPFPKSNTQSLPVYVPTEPANYVLEVASGTSDKYNFKTGDDVTIAL